MTGYKVNLEVYNGPLDLLLYLIRREEVDIYDIPIARVTAHYIKYVDLLKQLDPDGMSEFLVLAATLMEIKSRTLLPTPPPEEMDEDIADPRLELVRQLLAYKKFKDAAYHLDDAAKLQALKHRRSPTLSPAPADEVELDSIDIWDLFDAFNKLLVDTGRREAVHHVGIDDTPIALHEEDIVDSIEHAGGSQRFEEIFAGRSKSEMIGLFLALLELIRQRRIRVSQDSAFGTIWIYVLETQDDEPEPAEAYEDEPQPATPETESGAGFRPIEVKQVTAPTETVELPASPKHQSGQPDNGEAPPDELASNQRFSPTLSEEPDDETV